MVTYSESLEVNCLAYEQKVEERSGHELPAWKREEDSAFLARLVEEGSRTLVEIGTGTGVHGSFFQAAGLEVLCTDPSPAMVAHCRRQGLEAEVQDVLNLRLKEPVDAAFAMNCLLHVPVADLRNALESVAGCLRPGALLFWGQYGGQTREGPLDGDHYEPKRFFSSITDDTMLELATDLFHVVDFHTVDVGLADAHFQSLTLRLQSDSRR